jgi:hypothetical protein
MDDKKIERFLEMLTEIVGDNMPWKEKREHILGLASPDEKTNLEEFASWFESEENDEEKTA